MADFVINQRTLVYIAGDNGTISGTATQSVTIGQDGTEIVAIPNEGYHFSSWSDGVMTASRTDLEIQNSISVIANFSINTYTINYSSLEGGTISGSSTQIINHNSNGMNVIAVPNRGYRFINWSDGNTNTTRYEANVIENIELLANFRRNGRNYTSCTEYEYTDWTPCDNKIQTREIINAYPLGCIQNDLIIKQSCVKEDEKEEDKIQSTSTIQISTSTKIETKNEEKTKDNNEIVIFTKNLKFSDIDEEVRLLQKFLNLQGFIVTFTGPGSIGNETNVFGYLTKRALIKYQEAHKEEILTPVNLNSGTGYFGEMTRKYINKIFN